MNEKETFKYTYSAKEQEEIKAIRKKYETPKECADKMAQLRRLDSSVTQKATVFSLIFGVVGTLVLGTGMSLAMTDIGNTIGLPKGTDMLLGIILGLVGIALICLAYPIHTRIIKNEREKIAPEIIRLTDELMK